MARQPALLVTLAGGRAAASADQAEETKVGRAVAALADLAVVLVALVADREARAVALVVLAAALVAQVVVKGDHAVVLEVARAVVLEVARAVVLEVARAAASAADRAVVLEVAKEAVLAVAKAVGKEAVVVVNRSIRVGITLLELILALGLSAVLMFAIFTAIQIHWKFFDVRRTGVEEAQLARTILRSIGDDLRAQAPQAQTDLSGLDIVTENTGGAATAAANNAIGAMGATAGAAQGAAGAESEASAEEGTDPAADPTAPQAGVVALYGSATQLQFDISRLPRVDQYEAILSPESELGVVDIPSDIKTVTYFLRSEESALAGESALGLPVPPEPSSTGLGRGLMRRELDQAIASYASQGIAAENALSDSQLLAPEVVGLQFRYFDGMAWLSEWNSVELGGFPTAVEVTIVLESQQAAKPGRAAQILGGIAETTGTIGGGMPDDQVKLYTLVVNLPYAVNVGAASTAEGSTDSAEQAPAGGAQPSTNAGGAAAAGGGSR